MTPSSDNYADFDYLKDVSIGAASVDDKMGRAIGLTADEIGAAAWLSTASQRRPDICTLLGPTKHYRSFDAASLRLGKLHWLVFSVGSHRADDSGLGTTPRERDIYWDTHRRKLDLSALAYVCDLPTPEHPASDRYVGRDTLAEIAFCRATGVPVAYQSETWVGGAGMPASPTRPAPGHGA